MTTPVTSVIKARMAGLASELQDKGAIRSPEWAQAFSNVPRHVFLPRFYEQHVDDRGITYWRPYDDADPERWLDTIYADTTLVTDLDPRTAEQAADGGWTGIPTSSSTQPSLMAGMLEELDVQDGHRVLEVGTGTGYNAALMSHRCGDANVYSIDVDPGLVAAARQHLAGLGRHPQLRAGDGRDGYQAPEQFDRLIATCSVTAIPPAWLEQTRPSGIILTDLTTGIEGGLVKLTVTPDGHASGSFTRTRGRFMPARAESSHYDKAAAPYGAPALGTRDTHVSAGKFLASYSLRLLVGLHHPELTLVYHVDDDTGATSVQLNHPDGSWARSPGPGQPGEGTTTHGGNRDPWRAVEATWNAWVAADECDHTRIEITATPNGYRSAIKDPVC